MLSGYNGSTLKDTARAVLLTDDELPLLAQWQFGLGRSIAWTSDTKGQWASDLIRWEQFPRFAAQMIGWVLPVNSDQEITTDIQVEQGQTTIIAYVQDGGDSPDNMQVSAALLPAGKVDAEELDAIPEIALHPVVPGEYRATIPNPKPDSYIVQIRGTGEGSSIQPGVAGLVIPYSAEYRQDQSNPALLNRLSRSTGGENLEQPAMAFARTSARVTRAQEIALPLLLLALLLLPLDIAARRVLLQRRDVSLAGSKLRARFGVQREAPLPDDDEMMVRLSSATRRAVPRTRKREPGSGNQEAETRTQNPEPGTKEPAGSAGEEATGDPLARLREARERARRRARGEE
jgi:hypothetical protein